MRYIKFLLLAIVILSGAMVAYATGFSNDVTIDLTVSHETLRVGQTSTSVVFDIQVTGTNTSGTVQFIRSDTNTLLATITTNSSGHASVTTQLGEDIIPDELGEYSYQVVISDLAVCSPIVTVTVTTPQVELSSPANRITYLSPATVPLEATLIACDGLVIDQVQFYQGETLLQTLTSAPYAGDWSNMSLGTYVLTAKAYIHEGDTLISAPVLINISDVSVLTAHPDLNIDSGQSGDRWNTAISADGRYVAFVSDDANLVLGDTNEMSDVFVYDRQACTLVRVNINTAGDQADSDAADIAISADGRYVTFSSFASNLVSGDTNEQMDVFVRDRQSCTTTRVSIAGDCTQADGPCWGASISADGTWVAFLSDAASLRVDQTAYCGLYAKNRFTGELLTLKVFHQGNQLGGGTAISADGSLIAFSAPGDELDSSDTSEFRKVYVIARQTLSLQRVSIAMTGSLDGDSWGPSISADGDIVTFVSDATNLAAGDSNEKCDVIIYDRQYLTTTRIATPQGNDNSWEAQVSGDGLFVVYTSDAANLVGDTNNACDIFRYDLTTGEQARLTIANDGSESNADSWDLAVSADGMIVAYTSYADNLAALEAGGNRELYVAEVTEP